jgi:glycosyltransferase involved in cell wall biosynthesis
MAPLKVLFLSHGVNARGGAEVVLRDLILSLPADKIEAQCVFPQPAGVMVDTLKEKGIKTHTVAYTGYHCYKDESLYKVLNLYYGIQTSVDTIVEIIKSEKIDVVVTNTIIMMDGALAARKCGIPHIWYVHEMFSVDPVMQKQQTLPPERFYKLMFMLSALVVVVSNAVRGEIEQFVGDTFSEKVKVIHNGIEIGDDFERGERARDKIVLAVGSLCKRKGFIDLIRVARKICDIIPEARFIVAGRTDKVYSPCLWEERKRLDLEKNFTFLKFCKEMDILYRKSSILAVTASAEPFGLTVLEGMKYGLPVVSTKCGGPEEIIVEGKTGFISSLYEDYTNRLVWLLTHDEEADVMGSAGFLHVKKNFPHSSFVSNFMDALMGLEVRV